MRLRVGVKLFWCRAIRGLICYWCERRGEPLQRGCVKNDPRENCDPREKSREQGIQLKWNSSEFQRLRACYLVKINKSIFSLLRFVFFISSQFILQTHSFTHFFSLSMSGFSPIFAPAVVCVWVCAASICEMCVCIIVADGLHSFRIDNIYRLKWESSIFTRLLSEAGPNFIIPNY